MMKYKQWLKQHALSFPSIPLWIPGNGAKNLVGTIHAPTRKCTGRQVIPLARARGGRIPKGPRIYSYFLITMLFNLHNHFDRENYKYSTNTNIKQIVKVNTEEGKAGREVVPNEDSLGGDNMRRMTTLICKWLVGPRKP